MLLHPTLDKLEAMRLHGMAQGLREQGKDANVRELSFDERFGLLVDRQFLWRQNEAFAARLRRAKLRSLRIFLTLITVFLDRDQRFCFG